MAKGNNIHEFNLNYIDTDDMASITIFQTKHVNQIKKLMAAHPDEIRIVAGENIKENDRMMVVHLPKKYCNVSFGERAKREITDEQRAAASERMKKALEVRKAKAEAKKREEESWL